MKKLMSLLLSTALCFSLAMPTIAFGAEESVIESDMTNTNPEDDTLDKKEDESILENDETEQSNQETALNDDKTEENDDIISDSDEAEENHHGDDKAETDNNEINSGDDMPVVSITMDETGKIQKIDSDEGILVEPALPEEEDITDAEILNRQGEIDSEENVVSEKMQAKAAPIQGVLTDYYGTYIKSFKSDDEKDSVEEHIINGANSNMQKYTYYSTKTHYNHKVSITIRSEGVGLNERLSTSAGKIDYSDTSELIDVVLDPTNNCSVGILNKV